MGAFRLLRRVGGLRRLILGFILILVAVYCCQTFILNTSTDKSSRGSANGGRKLTNIPLQPVVVQGTGDGDRGNNSTSVQVHPHKIPAAPTEVPKKPPVPDGQRSIKKACGLELECGSGELIFKLSAVLGETSQPHACLNDLSLFHSDKLAKGLNVVILDAFEQVGSVNDKDGDGAAEVSGCLKLPIGEIDPKISFEDEEHGNREAPNLAKNVGPGPMVSRRDKIIYGVELPHCGMKDPCKKGTFALSVYSGKHKDDVPKMCINGRFVVDRNLNKAGRGLNIVVLNSTAVDVLRVGHFDTYAEDSSTLEIFLEQTVPTEMIVVLSFDEASTRLSSMAKQMFYELGSGLVQNVKFRASWYFVGQKGITGFTPFEELNFASGTEWAKPVDQKLCVPAKLDGRKVRPDPIVQTKNEPRRHFCKKNDGYEEFCDEAHVDKLLTPTPLFNKSMEGNSIFKVPLLVVAGLAHNSLRLCLETILRQPGIDPLMVLVTFDENYPEGGELGKLFGFQTLAVNASASYTGQLSKSLEAVWVQFPNADVCIVLEEELMLAGDFLVYMSQLLPILRKDESLLSVSAWNDNGFLGASTRSDSVYRVEGFPGLGFMLRKKTYQEFLANQMEECCGKRVWDGWSLRGVKVPPPHMLVPDVSRVIRRHSDGLGVLEPHLEDLFHRERAYTKESESWLSHPDYLLKQNYDTQLNYSLASAKALEKEDLKSCAGTTGPASITLPKAESKKVLRILCKCFGLFSSPDSPAKGLYKSVLRFSYQEYPMFLVGSSSPFFSRKPKKLKIFDGKS